MPTGFLSVIRRTVLSILLATAALIAFGCANESVVVLTNNGTYFPAVKPDSVHITTEFLPSESYVEVGYLYMQESGLENVVRLSRKRAGEVGGEAIMNARVGVKVKQSGSFLSFPIYDRAYFVRGIVVRRKALP